MKNKVKAFTVMEMLLNMVIMSIIIGMVYFAYSTFAKQVTFYHEDIQEQRELDVFLLQFKTDFFNANKVVKTSNGSIDVLFYDTSVIKYVIKDNFIFRKQEDIVDSLSIKKVNLETITNSITGEELVEKVIVSTYLFNETLDFITIKKHPIMFEYGN